MVARLANFVRFCILMRTRQTIRENVNVNEKSYLSFAPGTQTTSAKYHKDTVQLGTE